VQEREHGSDDFTCATGLARFLGCVTASHASPLAGNHPRQSVKSRQGRRLEDTTIASVEAHFADRDSPAVLSFQDLAVANPIAGCFPEDIDPSVVEPPDRPNGRSSGSRGLQDQSQFICWNVTFWPFRAPPRLVGGTYLLPAN
jgi:hypothetical protein